jgi:DNA-3-methyladenine glycosylase II
MATSVIRSAELHPHHQHLLRDKKLKKLIGENGLLDLPKRKNVFIRLCGSILSQQLSTKVAAVIYKRFLDLYGKKEPTPQQVIDTPDTTLRGIGLSNAKVSYVKNVARFAIEKGMEDKQLRKMGDEEVIEYLVGIKGVGRWTVEMLLMFTLGREDLFAVDDLGIQNAMISLFKLDRSNKKQFYEDMRRISQKWSPYRSYACLYLWRYKDNPPDLKVKKKK